MKKKRRLQRDGKLPGIYVLPNLMTTLNLFCGFYAVIAVINGKFTAGAIAIIIAGIFDLLDGKIARLTNTTSRFGVEYDSLADLVSFGLAPALMMYLWALRPMGKIGWLAAFLFTACGALRLARFNTQTGTVSSDYFVGLPIPAAAGMNAVTILICHHLGINRPENPVPALVTLYFLSFLMVSTIPYNSFKNPELFRRINFNVLVGVILILVFVAAQPQIALFLIGSTYVLSGPVMALKRSQRLARKPTPDSSAEKPGSASTS
jgi:CDP-diacylglycerol--serine O-phosphatidyltransferase